MAEPVDLLAEGRYIRLVRRGRWEWAERTNASGIVVVAALTPEREMLLVEQFRPPVAARVIELPAGLAGDIAGEEDEALSRAARRELEEETGYTAARMEPLTEGPVSAGMTSECLTFFRGHELSRIGEGGGDSSEDIVVHRVPLADVHTFITERAAAGVMTDPKVYVGLHFLQRAQ